MSTRTSSMNATLLAEKRRINEHIQKNHLKLNFILGFLLIGALMVILIALPWAKRPDVSGQVGLFWHYTRDWEPRYSLLANLLEKTRCEALVPQSDDNFCQKEC